VDAFYAIKQLFFIDVLLEPVRVKFKEGLKTRKNLGQILQQFVTSFKGKLQELIVVEL
jgi:hypothetical protein